MHGLEYVNAHLFSQQRHYMPLDYLTFTAFSKYKYKMVLKKSDEKVGRKEGEREK